MQPRGKGGLLGLLARPRTKVLYRRFERRQATSSQPPQRALRNVPPMGHRILLSTAFAMRPRHEGRPCAELLIGRESRV